MFCNTFHLLVQPGVDLIEQAGNIHNFMNYSGPIITDSGISSIFITIWISWRVQTN